MRLQNFPECSQSTMPLCLHIPQSLDVNFPEDATLLAKWIFCSWRKPLQGAKKQGYLPEAILEVSGIREALEELIKVAITELLRSKFQQFQAKLHLVMTLLSLLSGFGVRSEGEAMKPDQIQHRSSVCIKCLSAQTLELLELGAMYYFVSMSIECCVMLV